MITLGRKCQCCVWLVLYDCFCWENIVWGITYHILHLAVWKSAKPVSGVKLAWTDTFRHLISALHSRGRTAPTPCVSNLNLIGDHRQSQHCDSLSTQDRPIPQPTDYQTRMFLCWIIILWVDWAMLFDSIFHLYVNWIGSCDFTFSQLSFVGRFFSYAWKSLKQYLNQWVSLSDQTFVIWTYCQVGYVSPCVWQSSGLHQRWTLLGGE